MSVSVLTVSGQGPPHDSVQTSRSGGVISRYTPRISMSVPSARRQTKCHAPPRRRSISQTGMVQPSGPSIHCGTCLGLVQASKTSRRGASNTRVMTTSWSEGVVKVVGLALSVAPMAPLLLLHLLQVAVQSPVARVPEGAIVVGPLRDL